MTAIAPARLGDSCIVLQLGTTIDADVNARCIALGAALEQLALQGVRDVVPTYNAVTVHFDPLTTDVDGLETALDRLYRRQTSQKSSSHAAGRTIEIPVTYGGTAGPDLSAVAAFAGCSEADVVRLHTQMDYRVYMLGFLPGFAYMGSVDARIAMPRLETPRMRVAAGSVGIAGSQTGVYPCDTPGGWRIIGHTSVKLFDPSRTEVFLLKAGDRVKFAIA
jgi:inhibitor of KinA